ncbi:Muniscin C-terminal [Kalmanozyma brasiliensis GHG001]|uniref:MHD domain-containing protein n=1 Tax=Kalmanozyma brasiliensis (strain GHG001) TaxID=1365824 RepID=V5ELE4_KALBG|nr:Muniscin C-terminal [Kalmanozyma brasiliensis GHG001]EST05870.1 Muniscin C-terminal [Kalmanozyma brasiliensis GHG001]
MAEPNPGAAFAPNAYANAFISGKPRDTTNLVQQRLRKAKLFNEELADYFAARRELEEAYLKQLQKISKRTFLSDPSSIPPGYAPVYERLVQELAEVASAHGELEKRIAEDCEGPIRNASSKGEWGRIKDHDDSLANTLRELNSLESQLQKDQKKLEGASSKKASQANAKVQETERSISQTMEIWETEAPFAFEAYQRIDAQRLELLKETVAKFETAQSDAAQRIMSSSEKTMQECLTFDTQADMQDFILKNGTVGGTSSSAARNGRLAAPRPAAPTSLNRQSSVAGRSISSRTGADSSSRGRSNGAGLGEFGASSASIHSADRTQDGTPSKSTGSTLKNAFSRFGRGRANKDSANTQTVYGGLPDEPADSSFSSMNRSGTLRQNSAAPGGASSSSRNAAGLAPGDDSMDSMAPGSGGGLMAPMVPSSAPSKRTTPSASAAGATGSDTAAPLVDSEGYSIPPPDRKPWETAAIPGAATSPAAAGSSLMDDDEDSRDTFDSTLNNRVSSMNIASQPITEDASKDKAALERMKSTLLTSGPPTRRGTTRRDRRDVRNTTYNPAFGAVGASGGDENRLSQFGTLTASPQASAPVSPSPFAPQSTFTGTAGVGAHRTQSIASVASSSNPFENSATTSPVKASLSERVNAIFVGREISKVMVVGELSIAVTPAAAAGAGGKMHIRIESFEQLEKAAPNPAFLTPVANAAGEYLLDTKALLEQGTVPTGNGGQAVVLKYQLHISDSRKNEYVPVQLHAQWRCEPHQTSFLLTYTPNTTSRLSSSTEPPAVVQDLQFAVQLQPSTVSNIMSKPTATYVAETKSLFWKINETLPLAGSEGDTRKLLARCQIEGGQTVPSAVHLRWKVLGKTVSGLGVVSIGEGTRIEEVVRQCVAGKFIASP